MRLAGRLVLAPTMAGVALILTLLQSALCAQQDAVEPVYIGADAIGGAVRSATGAEAGVWVIAETTDLPTKFTKIVVTDDKGQYLLPDLPPARYDVWVRGYGLVDSTKVRATPGKVVILRAELAPNAEVAAEYYPTIYRIAVGRLPAQGPARPQGIERNVVISMWDGASPKADLHGTNVDGKRDTYREPKGKEPPSPGYSARGMDVDRNGVVWASLASGHLASFDRRKCKQPLKGAETIGRQCPEGWTLYPFPGPLSADATDPGSAEANGYTWVDRHNTFGLGRDIPIATGDADESLLALVRGKWINLRVPYPMGFCAEGLDGRVDDPNAGWKGRGLWTTFSCRTLSNVENGKGAIGKLVRFQLRPNPVAG
jgi:hypothetical protein